MTTGGLDPDPPDPGERVDVEAIRARADAATPGPWESSHEPRHARARVWAEAGTVDVCEMLSSIMDERFIAHARADVPALCDALERERRISSAWRALATARWEAYEQVTHDPDGRVSLGVLKANDSAVEALLALGIDPEAP